MSDDLYIVEIDPENALIATDICSTGKGPATELFAQFIDGMRDKGVSDEAMKQ